MKVKFYDNDNSKKWDLCDITTEQMIAIVNGVRLLAERKSNPYKEAGAVSRFLNDYVRGSPGKLPRRRHFKIRAKERTTGLIVTPEYIGFKTDTEIIEFFGLEEPDIEWYEIIEETPHKTIIINKNNGTMD